MMACGAFGISQWRGLQCNLGPRRGEDASMSCPIRRRCEHTCNSNISKASNSVWTELHVLRVRGRQRRRPLAAFYVSIY